MSHREPARKITAFIPAQEVASQSGRPKHIAPAQYHFDRYYTQHPGQTLFSAMRRAIKHPCQSLIMSLGNKKLWELDHAGEYLFITDKAYAKRAQQILVRTQKLNFQTSYRLCTDLKQGGGNNV